MNKLVLVAAASAWLLAPACIKSGSEAQVKNDGAATVKLSASYNKEVISNIKEMMEMGGGDEEMGEASDALAAFEGAFDEKRVVELWKKLGVEVTKSAATDKDGWKGVEIEGTIKNVSEYARKHAEHQKQAAATRREGLGGGVDPGMFMTPNIPRFYKTAQANVAKVVMADRDVADNDEIPDMDDLDDEQREQMDEGIDQMRSMFGLDDMKIEARVKLPGKILSVSNLKQNGDHEITFSILGANLSVDTMHEMSGAAKRSATLEFDPAEFKIVLEDEPKPKAESQPAPKVEEKKREEEEKKKEEDE